MKLTITLTLLIGMALGGFAFNPAIAKKAKNCHYTFITDGGDPGIGENGELSYEDDWKLVLSKGFKLHNVVVPTSGRPMYIFERCK